MVPIRNLFRTQGSYHTILLKVAAAARSDPDTGDRDLKEGCRGLGHAPVRYRSGASIGLDRTAVVGRSGTGSRAIPRLPARRARSPAMETPSLRAYMWASGVRSCSPAQALMIGREQAVRLEQLGDRALQLVDQSIEGVGPGREGRARRRSPRPTPPPRRPRCCSARCRTAQRSAASSPVRADRRQITAQPLGRNGGCGAPRLRICDQGNRPSSATMVLS